MKYNQDSQQKKLRETLKKKSSTAKDEEKTKEPFSFKRSPKKLFCSLKSFFTDPITRPAPIVYLGFFTCIILTAVLFSYSSYYQFLHEKDEFSSSLKEFNRELKERRSAYLGLLKGEKALFLFGGQNLNAQNWRQYIENVRDQTLHSGLSGFSYIEERTENGLSSASVKFLYDTNSDMATFTTLNITEGSNLFANPAYKQALLHAKQTQKTVGLKAFLPQQRLAKTISQKSSPYPFLVFLPVFENVVGSTQKEGRFMGWIMGVVDFKTFFDSALPDDLVVKIWDQGTLVHDTFEKEGLPSLHHKQSITILDYHWEILLASKTKESALFYKISSYLIPIIGFLLSVAVSFVLWSQTTTRRRAQAMADRMSLDLRASEYKNRTIIENVPGAIFRSSPEVNWQMEFMSDAIEEISGVPSTEFTSHTRCLSDILFEDDISQVEQAVGFIPTPGHTYDVEYRIHHADGRLRWVSERGRVITNTETGRPYLMGTIFDVTDRKNKESDLRNLTAALQNAVEGIAFINSDFEYERVNEAYLSIFKAEEKDLLGTPWFEALLPEDQDKAKSLQNPTKAKKRLSAQVRANRSDGSIIHIHAVFVPSVDELEEQDGYYCFVRDVTEQIKKEEALAFAMEEAKNANHTKSEFLATMSHELRTPLNAIIGYSEILMEEAEEESLDAMSEDLQKINTAGRHLLELINDILDVSKLEAGKMTIHLEKFDIYTVVKNIRDLMIPTVAKNHNELILDCDEKIGEMYSDFTKVRQALFNLVSNAAKFTEKGSITIRVRETKKDLKEFITFEIEDSGCGISDEQIKKLFRPFTQADSSTTRKYGGTGLGLTITKSFCTMLEGDVTVSSEYGKGSIFMISLPRITRHDLAEKLEKKQTAEDLKQKKVV